MNDYELKPAPVKHEKETVENRPDDLRSREDKPSVIKELNEKQSTKSHKNAHRKIKEEEIR